jgi:hypothetical protein
MGFNKRRRIDFGSLEKVRVRALAHIPRFVGARISTGEGSSGLAMLGCPRIPASKKDKKIGC